MPPLPIAVVLDANVLFPILLCDILLRAAERGLYRVVLTQAILEEVRRSLHTTFRRRDPNADVSGVDRRIAAMRQTFNRSLVRGYEGLIPFMQNDEGDRHVLAAAYAKAGVIVTNNVRHFPAAACAPWQIAVQTADEFLCNLWALAPGQMADILTAQAADYRQPRCPSATCWNVCAAHRAANLRRPC